MHGHTNIKPSIYVYILQMIPYPQVFRSIFCIHSALKKLPTGWTVQGTKPGGGEIFRTRPDRPCGPQGLLYNGNRFFPRSNKVAGVWLWPPTPSIAEVERVDLLLCSTSGPSRPVLGELRLFSHHYCTSHIINLLLTHIHASCVCARVRECKVKTTFMSNNSSKSSLRASYNKIVLKNAETTTRYLRWHPPCCVIR
jgi:hypothetical protein